jgi:hypothetical protein
VLNLLLALAKADAVSRLFAKIEALNQHVIHKGLRDEDLFSMSLNCPKIVYQRYIAKKEA